jgi:hypothetical protein
VRGDAHAHGLLFVFPRAASEFSAVGIGTTKSYPFGECILGALIKVFSRAARRRHFGSGLSQKEVRRPYGETANIGLLNSDSVAFVAVLNNLGCW